jgi:hypothetical protein
LEGASARAVVSYDASPAAFVRLTMGEPSRSCHGEGSCPSSPGPGSARRVLPGVRGAARAHSPVGNRRGPSAWPASGKDPGYKPMVKSLGGQRESEGVVVPMNGVRDTSGGKGPCFDHAHEVGKREGMTGSVRSNYLRQATVCRSRRGAVGGLAGESATTATGAMGCGQAVRGSAFPRPF